MLILVSGTMAADLLKSGRRTIGEITDANGHAWYARDDRTLYRTDLTNTYIVFRAETGIRNRELHILSPVVIERQASASQSAAWISVFEQ